MSLKEEVKNSFISGLLLLTPLIVSVVVLRLFFGWTSGISDIFIDVFNLTALTGQTRFVSQILVLTVTGIGVVLVGSLARTRPGRKVLGGFGRLINLVPVYRSFYFSIRHFANSLVENRSHYENAVIVEYPQEDCYRLGFTTSRSPKAIREAAGEDLLNVYLPNSPTPTAGITVFLPEEKIYEVDISVRKAFKLLLTTGISNEEMNGIIPEE